MKVVSVNIGEKRTLQWGNKLVETGIFKEPTDSIVLGVEDVINDNVVNRKYHGGVDKACYLYSADHYAYWKKKYPSTATAYGAMGENITIQGLNERSLNVGDRYALGSAIVEISEPRQPCFKLNLRLNSHNAIKDFISLGHCGSYLRIVQKGAVKPGDEMILISKGKSISIFDLFQLIYKKIDDSKLLENTLQDPAITAVVKEELHRVWNTDKEE